METLLKAYADAAEVGALDVTTQATFQTGALYQDFGAALMKSQRPKKLNKAELEQYNVMLEEQAFPFEEKAIELFETNARRTAAGVYDEWVRRSLAELARLKPVRYAKTAVSYTHLDVYKRQLQAQLMMARQDHAGAAALLQGLKGSPTAGLYARFNLGVALIRAGNVKEGKAWLDDVGRAPGANEEMRALRDRANLALGFAELQAEEPREARAALQRVRLNAQQSNKALLGLGWAATALKDPQLALVPFTELAGRSPADSAVLEAQIALPYAMAEFGAYSRALEGYEQAVTRFGSERQALQQAITSIRGGALVQALLAHNPGEAGLGAFSQVEKSCV